jgi:FkbM family methyltransferase
VRFRPARHAAPSPVPASVVGLASWTDCNSRVKIALDLKIEVQRVVQRALGLDAYLDLFARYRLLSSRWDARDGAFRTFLGRLPQDGLVLDVGANVGVMTVSLARHVRRGTVHAFEPNPVSYGAARRLVTRLGLANVVLHPFALARAEGEVEMVMPVEVAVRQHGLSHVVSGPDDTTAGERFRVPCRALDEMPEWFAPGARVTGIKIDAENYEAEVLEGGRKLLTTHRPLVYCELWLTANRDRTVALLRELGYSAMVYRSGALEPFEPWPHASDQDFFFVPETRA